MQKHQTTDQITDEIFDLYERHGHEEYSGESVSQLEHMSQAAQWAIQEGFDDEVVLAAFFHDIGHLCVQKNADNQMGGFGVKQHEKIGSAYLREKGFSEKITRLVENHVQAKRYLTYAHPEYYDSLSEASKKTLEYQGGKMTAGEASVFREDRFFETSIRMRRWDELAKETGISIIDLNEIRGRVIKVLSKSHLNMTIL